MKQDELVEIKPQNQALFSRFYQYQQERFPFLVHGLLIAAFSFSAIAYSRLVRDVGGFVPLRDYGVCALTNVVIFFWLRVSDEHKDQEIDARYRAYLPVPRGLISLGELRAIGYGLLVPVTLLNVGFYPALLPFYGLTLGYLFLMRYEFFAGHWLNNHQVWYMVSHMVIIPLNDLYASSFDWKLNGAVPGLGLLFFFLVSYLNGVVLEVGRKLKAPEAEEVGVVSYTGLWGHKAPLIWMGLLTANFAAACLAAYYAGHHFLTFAVLTICFGLALTPAIRFLNGPTTKRGKAIELASVAWAFGMYLTLGGIPLLWQLIRGQ